MALWYFGPTGNVAEQICFAPSDSEVAREEIAKGHALAGSDGLASSMLSEPLVNTLHRAWIEVKTKRLVTFQSSVTCRNAKFALRIDASRKKVGADITATLRHEGRPLDPSGDMLRVALEHFSTANTVLFTWLISLLEQGRIDYRAQSPKIRLDEGSDWGHPFPYSDADLLAYRDEIEAALQSCPALMAQKWASERSISRGISDLTRQRMEIMNALPDGAPIALVDADRLYGHVRIKIGRKTRKFGPEAAKKVRLLNEGDLALMEKSRHFNLSRHAVLHLIGQMRSLSNAHPDAVDFGLPSLSLGAAGRTTCALDIDPVHTSFHGGDHSSPTSISGTLPYSWIQAGADMGLKKRFFPTASTDKWHVDPSSISEANFAGLGLQEAIMPKTLYHHPKLGTPPLKLQDAFQVADLWVVSSELRAFLRGFNTGGCSFLPVHLRELDDQRIGNKDWFYLAFPPGLELFSHADSPRSVGTRRQASPPYDVSAHSHDMIALRPSPEPERDLWTDRNVKKSFFVSGRLAMALRKSDLNLRLGLKRCLPAPMN